MLIHNNKSIKGTQKPLDDIKLLGVKARILQANLASKQDTRWLISQMLDLGPLFAVINNASIFTPLSLTKMDLEYWEQHLRIHVTAPFLLGQAFAKSISPEEEEREDI